MLKTCLQVQNPYMFRSFFTPILRGSSAVLCAVTIPPADLHSLILYYYAVCGRMCMSSVCVWWSACHQADHQQTRTPNTHIWHTHAATYCIIIWTQRTQNSGRNSSSTKHSGGHPEDGREKRQKHVGVLYLQTLF
jgi:fatty-acid desaturase